MSTTISAKAFDVRAKSEPAPSIVPLSLFALSTFGQRLGFWLSGFPFPLVLFISPLLFGYGLFKQRLKVSIIRTFLFSLMVVSFSASFAFGRAEWLSVQSAILLLAVYAPWVLYAPTSSQEYDHFVRRVAFWAGVLGVLAAMQYAGQFLVPSELWFSWRSVISKDFLIEYNTLNELSYGAGIYKGNGLFLLEPSTLSGLVARVLLLTVVALGTLKYALPLGVGLLAALSGTGLVFTGLFTVPASFRLITKRSLAPRQLFLLTVVTIGFALLLSNTFVGQYFVDRTHEFSNPRASGYARFTSTFIVFQQYLTRDLGDFLLGYGPGSFKHLARHITDETFGSGWIKLFIEYGFMGFLTFSAFFLYCVYTSTRSAFLSIALLTQYLILDGAIAVPQLAFLTFAIFIFPVRSASR